ncbi:ATP-binding protein [Krasilnikovia sp. MM14-A1259]|uniref:ATP-binding protein n=1 Tax=Krasilnikovia sp. MM14-A1259 TaxID=3373539 RepID=UPI00382B94C3
MDNVNTAAQDRTGQVVAAVRGTDPNALAAVLRPGPTDGAPIAAADRTRIFDRFVRLDGSRSRTGGGAGLGLPIAHELIAAHGGPLAVDDRNDGAAMRVRLPLESDSSNSQESAPTANPWPASCSRFRWVSEPCRCVWVSGRVSVGAAAAWRDAASMTLAEGQFRTLKGSPPVARDMGHPPSGLILYPAPRTVSIAARPNGWSIFLRR